MATQKNTAVKCKLCEKKLVSKQALISHIERVHAASIPKGWSSARYENYLRTGKTEGRCVECHKPTTWNETTGKYNRMCGSDACRKKSRERASKNYIGLHGKPYSINNPEQQAKMIYGRKNSGTYIFEDDKEKTYEAKYDSSYGLDFLEMIDTLLSWDGQDVSAPSPHVYWYEYEGKKHFYIPDVYLHTINCEVEIKDGGDNPNMHPKIQAVDKVKEAAKDKVMESLKGQVNYIKICNKDYSEFFAMLSRLKAQDECPLPKWESKLEPALEASSHMDVCRVTDDNKLSQRFSAYHLDEKKRVGQSPWDEELYSKSLDQEICNVLSSISLHVQKGKTTRFVYTLGKDYKAVLLGAITIYWHDYWDHADPQYDFEWDYQEEIDASDLDEQYVIQEAADPFKAKTNLLKRNKLLKDPMLNYDTLLLYYRNKLFHERLNKQQWVVLYSELENVRDYLKSVINGNTENDERMKYEAKNALKQVTGFLSYMDDMKPMFESAGAYFAYVSETKEYESKLDKPAILKELQAFARQYPVEKWRVGFKAALVMYDIFSETNDIDVFVTEDVCKSLIRRGFTHVPAPYGGERITVTDRLEAFENQSKAVPKKINGFYVDDIDEIYNFYKRMNRPKDQETLRRIESYKKHGTVISEGTDVFTSGDFDEYIQYADLDSAAGELFEGVVSHLDANYSGKERFNLSDYRAVPISASVLSKYKGKYPMLKHIREDDGGLIWFDGDNVVGVVGAAPHKETVDQSQIWIHSFEITKGYRNHGLSRQMIDYAINKLHARYLSVNKKNEVAFGLYKKIGFEIYGENKTMYFMKLKGSVTPEFIPISESYKADVKNVLENLVITKDDIRHNLDEWKPGVGTNVLLITGLSGSGKTTTGYEMAYDYKAELFQLDWIEHPEYMQDSPETPNYGLWQYIKKLHGRRLGNASQKTGDQWHNLVIDVFDSICRFAKMHPDKLFIIEGVQIPGHLHDVLGIEKYPIVIKGTSVVSSIIRRFKRDGIKDGFRTGGVNILKYYLDGDKYMNMFRGQIVSSEVTESTRTQGITFGKSESDILSIIKTMTPTEQLYLGTPGGARYNWSKSEFYQEVLYINGTSAAFLVVSEIPANKGVGHMIIGTRAGNQYRHKGYATILINRFLTSGQIPKHITELEWGFDEGNSKSEKLAAKYGFTNPTVSEDQLHHRGYVMTRGLKDIVPVVDAKSEVIRKSLIREENWYNSLESTYIEATKDDGRYFPVFIFLSYTGTNMAKLIKAFTHDPYAHSSLSFDTNLDNMVSFNRDGMVIEDIHKSVFKKNAPNIRYSLYMYMATEAEYDAMKNFVDELLGKKNKLKYNALGLTNFIFGRGSSREDRYFCSEFIAATISAENDKLFDRQPYMISPYYFAKNKNFIFIKTGILKNYDQKIVDNLVAEKLEEGGFSDVIIK